MSVPPWLPFRSRAGLARPADADERDDSVIGERVDQRRDLGLATDERRQSIRKVPHASLDGPQRRKSLMADLKQLLGRGEPLHTVSAVIDQLVAGQ